MAATEDNLREYSQDVAQRHLHNLFDRLFRGLAEAVTTRKLNISGTTDRTEDPTPSSDLSHSSDEDKPEDNSRQCLINLVSPVLEALGIVLKNGNEFKWYIYFFLFLFGTPHFTEQADNSNSVANPLKSKIYLGMKGHIEANTDGGIVL